MKVQLGKKDPALKRYLDMNIERPAKVMRKFMVEAYQQLTIKTPVDTGRARWGWNCSFVQPNFTIPMAAPDGQKNYYGLDAGRAKSAFRAEIVSGRETLYIANAVPYIVKLNEGWSRQAPARFFELAFENAVQKLTQYFKGLK